jgi:hypothetical protein
MKRLLCLALGHQKTRMPLTSTRFACRRCGLELNRAEPLSSQATEARLQRFVLSSTDPSDDPASSPSWPLSTRGRSGQVRRLQVTAAPPARVAGTRGPLPPLP